MLELWGGNMNCEEKHLFVEDDILTKESIKKDKVNIEKEIRKIKEKYREVNYFNKNLFWM